MWLAANGARKDMLIVGLGGTLREGSSTEKAIRVILAKAQASGAGVRMFDGPSLRLPLYEPGSVSTEAIELIGALRQADAIVIGSPGYHGGISGLVKNALDYTEEMSGDERPYLTGRAVACVATGSGWQGANTALAALRCVTHALRGWPTPLGIALNSSEPLFGPDGASLHHAVDQQLGIVAADLVAFARAGVGRMNSISTLPA